MLLLALSFVVVGIFHAPYLILLFRGNYCIGFPNGAKLPKLWSFQVTDSGDHNDFNIFY